MRSRRGAASVAQLTVTGTELKERGQVLADGPSLGYPPVNEPICR
jgi:hypothetical protein